MTLDHENEILTPTLKIRRERVEAVFAETAEALARQSAETGEMLVHWFEGSRTGPAQRQR